MKKKYNREEIERAWVEESVKKLSGIPLCSFIDYSKFLAIRKAWNQVWDKQSKVYMYAYFQRESYFSDLTYLCRALSLNMLLDDNEEYFE